MTEERFVGRIASVPGADGYSFIGINTVTKLDGHPNNLDTVEDIFLHRDECADDLFVDMQIEFSVARDRKRGKGFYRATRAKRLVDLELIPHNEETIPGFLFIEPTAQDESSLSNIDRLPVHANMKDVPEETVIQVIKNQPMPRIPRVNDLPADEETKKLMAEWLLANLFPNMTHFVKDYRVLNFTDEELDNLIRETVANYQALGLEREIVVLQEETERFKQTRGALGLMVEENLIRRDTVIPIKYLPDLFIAVPVWYYWVNPQKQEFIEQDWSSNDPYIHEVIKYFCGLFSNQKWYNTFQLFNRRVRSLKQYNGEIIPPHISRRMIKAVSLWDYVVIATPYHDQAGKDWKDIDWLRSIDPYVLGFKKGIPFFFVLARFSDAGTFPLFNELVADTIEFLRHNKDSLKNFNEISQPYWFATDKEDPQWSVPNIDSASSHWNQSDLNPFGNYLIEHVDTLLEAFDQGVLFDWLRDEVPQEDTNTK